MIRVITVALAVALAAAATPAQMATSPSHQLESLSVTGGGGLLTSGTHQMWYTLGQATPVSITSVLMSSSHVVQPGVIPTLYPRTRIGDSNDDGVADAADVVTSIAIANDPLLVPTNIVHFFNADANSDSQVGTADVLAIIDILLGR